MAVAQAAADQPQAEQPEGQNKAAEQHGMLVFSACAETRNIVKDGFRWRAPGQVVVCSLDGGGGDVEEARRARYSFCTDARTLCNQLAQQKPRKSFHNSSMKVLKRKGLRAEATNSVIDLPISAECPSGRSIVARIVARSRREKKELQVCFDAARCVWEVY